MSAPLGRPVIGQTYQCWRCGSRRSFASSGPRLRLGPESPRYIEVPEPPQQTVPDKVRIRGSLPVPRDLFGGVAAGRGLDRADEARIIAATPRSQRPSDLTKMDARQVWKENMAEARRKNLKEGLQALRDRRVTTDKRSSQRSARKQQERETLLHQPEREDERLTRPSIDPVLQSILDGTLQDPQREQRIADMKTRTELKEAARKHDRDDALHTLYMQARDFITTEAQLDQAVDHAFGTPDNPKGFGSDRAAPSIWDDGAPATVQDMLNFANRNNTPNKGGTGVLAGGGSFAALTKRRLTKIAEELTGGKMDTR